MRITRGNIDYYVNLLNNLYHKIDDKQTFVVVRTCDYYNLELVDEITTGARVIRSGLSAREVYNCVYCMFELLDRGIK